MSNNDLVTILLSEAKKQNKMAELSEDDLIQSDHRRIARAMTEAAMKITCLEGNTHADQKRSAPVNGVLRGHVRSIETLRV